MILNLISFWIIPLIGVVLLAINVFDYFTWEKEKRNKYFSTYECDIFVTPIIMMIPILNVIIMSILGIGVAVYFMVVNKDDSCI